MPLYYLSLLIFIFASEVLCQNSNENEIINLSVVACGDRVPETLTLLKSALMFTSKDLHFFIFTEPHLTNDFLSQFQKWPKFIQNKFKYTIQETSFPKSNQEEWRKLFKLCASQRLFLPELLSDVDSLLYVDTDVLFLTDLNEIWKNFYKFNESQLAALSPEHEDPSIGWYNRFARHPYYGKLGLNSGVMLMNLTRMREFKFTSKFFPLFNEFKYNITWGDQCLLNILFHYHPDKLYLYDCTWNFRPDHCMYGMNCKPAESSGAQILHGCRRVFHNDKEPAFRAIYSVFDNYNFDEEQMKTLYTRIEYLFDEPKIASTYCGMSKNIFLKSIKPQMESHLQIMKNAQEKYNKENNEINVNYVKNTDEL